MELAENLEGRAGIMKTWRFSEFSSDNDSYIKRKQDWCVVGVRQSSMKAWYGEKQASN